MIETKFGIYEAMGCKMLQKLDAFYTTVPHGHVPHWNFNEEVFNKFSWTVEPVESLNELYRQRAEQIRSKYECVILSWSGGVDSQNIAESFVNNNLRIDELVHRYSGNMLDPTNKDPLTGNLSNELLWAVPSQLAKLQQKQPDIKLTAWDWQKEIVDFWANNPDEDTTIHYPSTNGHVKHKILELVKADISKSTAIVYGLDKPRVIFQNNNFYMVFLDIIMHTQTTCIDFKNQATTEIFYWAPESAKMLIKQGHVIKNWFKQHPEFRWLLNPEPPNLELYNKIINPLIYTNHNENLWQSKKPTDVFACEPESWFINNTDHTATKNWKNAREYRSSEVKKMYQTSDHQYKIQKGYANLPGCYSKFYCLGS